MKIKLLLADENQLFRELLTDKFSETSDLEVVAEAGEGIEILDKAALINPDIVLTEVLSTRLNGIEITKTLQKEMPSVKVVALTTICEKNFIRGILGAKAWGYLTKNESFEHLSDGLRRVHTGNMSISPEIQSILLDDYLDRNKSKETNNLTKRETEILKLLAEGKSIKEISETYFISIKTAGTHKQNIFEKMGFDNVSQLVRYALKTGIIS
jgi:DNA-binding NarL/FixJ family response regulator